jgi:hypothetical protein
MIPNDYNTYTNCVRGVHNMINALNNINRISTVATITIHNSQCIGCVNNDAAMMMSYQLLNNIDDNKIYDVFFSNTQVPYILDQLTTITRLRCQNPIDANTALAQIAYYKDGKLIILYLNTQQVQYLAYTIPKIIQFNKQLIKYDPNNTKPPWYPVICNKQWIDYTRQQYPDNTINMSDTEVHDTYNNGHKYETLWDNVNEANYEYEKLADAYLELKQIHNNESISFTYVPE